MDRGIGGGRYPIIGFGISKGVVGKDINSRSGRMFP